MIKKKLLNTAGAAACAAMLTGIPITAGENNETGSAGAEVQILYTHDIHSHLDSFKTAGADGTTEYTGGLSRLSSVIEEKRRENPGTFLFDGGDFSMGTLYQTIYETEAAELTMLGKMGYDAVTLGNHEFDYRSKGVANMLISAAQKDAEDPSYTLPTLLISNIDWDKNTSEDNLLVKNALGQIGSREYTIIEKNGVRVGVFGVMGKDAEECAPESGLTFESIIETSEKMTEILKKEGADMIVCLSHSGTSRDSQKSEDELLAKAVPEIDVILSAHSHTVLNEPVRHGDTYIVSAGCYAENLGEIDLVQREDGRWELKSSCLNRADSSVKENKEILAELEQYKELVNESYLESFGYSFDQIIAENDVSFTGMDTFGTIQGEDTLGSIIADSYIYAVKAAEGENSEPVTLTVAPAGCIRDTLQKGELTAADIFRISSLGIGADRIPGYPLVSVYLTGEELKTIAEIDASISGIMSAAQLYPSGVHWEYNSNRLLLNRVTDVWIQNDMDDEPGDRIEIEDDRLYRVVADLYSAQMLSAVEGKSFGILSIVPKDSKGQKIEDFEAHIIRTADSGELKAWYALAQYLEQFDNGNGSYAQIPQKYAETEGRKIDTDSTDIIDLIKKPNKIACIAAGVVCAAAALIVTAAVLITKAVKKKKRKRQKYS